MVFALLPFALESILHLCGVLVGCVPAARIAIGTAGFVFGALLLVVVAVHDKMARGRIHPASVWVPLLLIVWSVFFNAVVASSSVGLKVADWLVH